MLAQLEVLKNATGVMCICILQLMEDARGDDVRHRLGYSQELVTKLAELCRKATRSGVGSS